MELLSKLCYVVGIVVGESKKVNGANAACFAAVNGKSLLE